MNWIDVKNLQPIPLSDIPQLGIDAFRRFMLDGIADGKRVVQFFGDPGDRSVKIFGILADDSASLLSVAVTEMDAHSAYPAITPEAPALHLFERELYEQTGIEPQGHPWLKPVRYGIAGISSDEKPYSFFSVEGEQIHEVGVGPIHAGVIEPGHFRFSCEGENVLHLEIELGFQHRGVERLFLEHRDQPAFLMNLAESIAGDTVIGHAGTFAAAAEALAEVSVSRRAALIRTIMSELERIANHIGDLSALANDVAYLTGNAVFGAMRTRVINTSLAICGSRFGRGMTAYGGVHFELTDDIIAKMKNGLGQIDQEFEAAVSVLFGSSSVLARFEKTGILSEETARQIGMVGPAARACGLAVDVRTDFPYGGYRSLPVHKLTLQSGDVFARAYIRYIEVKQSLRMILELLDALPEGERITPLKAFLPDHLVVSMSEGWRGEIVHTAITDADGRLERYKIKDPSFNNWFALALAVRGNGISDFPLCNKSFNLSYCGFDL